MSVGLANLPPLVDKGESPLALLVLISVAEGDSDNGDTVNERFVFFKGFVIESIAKAVHDSVISRADDLVGYGVNAGGQEGYGIHCSINLWKVGWGGQSGLSFDVLPLRSPTEGIRFLLDKVSEGLEVFKARLFILITGLNSHTFDNGRFILHPLTLLIVPQALGHRTLPEMAIVSSGVEDIIGERDWGG